MDLKTMPASPTEGSDAKNNGHFRVAPFYVVIIAASSGVPELPCTRIRWEEPVPLREAYRTSTLLCLLNAQGLTWLWLVHYCGRWAVRHRSGSTAHIVLTATCNCHISRLKQREMTDGPQLQSLPLNLSIKLPRIIHRNQECIHPGPWFNIKMSSYQYRKCHCGDKTVVRSSYLHNGISYTGKMSSLYWIGAQVLHIKIFQSHLVVRILYSSEPHNMHINYIFT